MTNSSLLARLDLLRAELPAFGAEAFLISQPENRWYLSGFTGSSGWLLITDQQALDRDRFSLLRAGRPGMPRL